MKKFSKKSLVLLIATALLLTVSVGSTVAYLVAGTGEVTNVFAPGKVNTDIDETFENNIKRSIQIENTGNIPVYVRVTLVGNWVDENNNIVAPWNDSGVSYNTVDWEKGPGNFYYYKTSVAPNSSTSNLLQTLITDTVGRPTNVGKVKLVVTVLHQSIQADPIDAVKGAWKWTPPTT